MLYYLRKSKEVRISGIPDQYAAQRLGHDIAILKSIYQHLGLDKQLEIDDSIKNMHKEKDKKKETRLTSD